MIFKKLNNPRLQAEGSEFIDWKSTSVSVIPAHAGIQKARALASTTAIDRGSKPKARSSIVSPPSDATFITGKVPRQAHS